VKEREQVGVRAQVWENDSRTHKSFQAQVHDTHKASIHEKHGVGRRDKVGSAAG